MTKMHQQIALSLTFVLVAGLAACAKPSEMRSKEMSPSVSTSSDPATAEAENKKIAAEKIAAEKKRLAEGGKQTPAQKKEEDADAARKQAALDDLKNDMDKPPVSPQQVGTTAAQATAPVSTASSAPAPVANGEIPNNATSGTTATGATGETSTTAEGQNSDPESSKGEAAAAQSEQPVVGEETPATIREREQKFAFIHGLIEPTLRANFAVREQRKVVLEIQKKLVQIQRAGKGALTEKEAQTYLGLRTNYLVTQTDPPQTDRPMEELLARVGPVKLPIVMALLAQKSKFGLVSQVGKEHVSKLIQHLNTSTEPDVLRYRAVRGSRMTSEEQIIAMLGANAGLDSGKDLIAKTKEISNLLTMNEALAAEFIRVEQILSEEQAGSTTATPVQDPPLKAQEATQVAPAVKSSAITRLVPVSNVQTQTTIAPVAASAPGAKASGASASASSAN